MALQIVQDIKKLNILNKIYSDKFDNVHEINKLFENINFHVNTRNVNSEYSGVW